MQTSSRKEAPPLLHLVGESALVALAGALVLALRFPRDLGGHLHPYPLWAVVLVMAARYGASGLAVSVPVTLGTMLAVSTALSSGIGSWLLGRWPLSDLASFLLALLVSFIASGHQGRRRALEDERQRLQERLGDQEATLAELLRTAVALRARVDQLHTSLSFQRAVAERLESGDARAAAQAALELATARTGATRGAVRLWCNGRLDEIAATVAPGAPGLSPTDCTAAAALRRCRAVHAGELSERGEDDSDLAAPISDDTGALLGVIALGGVDSDARTSWAARELTLIADWCKKSMSTPPALPLASAVGGEGH